MNRQYTVGEYLEMIDRVESALAATPEDLPPAITTDVICGFPGETEEDFARSVDVARRVGFLHMHVFPFSPKAGTAAARWRDRHVPDPVVRRRVRTLIDLEEDPQDGLAIRYRRRLRGRSVRVILEQPDRGEPGVMTGRCDHYALVHVNTSRPRGTLVRVRISEVTASRTRGEVEHRMPLPVLAGDPGGSNRRIS
jgi:threonylcarbamoyladenosine tRNA methylthiotransferase MtaB